MELFYQRTLADDPFPHGRARFAGFVDMVVAIILGVVLGVAVTYWEPGARAVLYLCQILMTMPGMAKFGILLPLLK